MTEQLQSSTSSLPDLRAEIMRLKDLALQKPAETIQALHHILSSLCNEPEDQASIELKAEAYHGLSLAQTTLANYDEAVVSARTALTLFHQLGKREMMASALNNFGRIEYYRGNYHKALDFYNDSLALRRETGDKKGTAAALNNIGLVYYSIENHSAALKHYEESLTLKRELNDKKGIASTLNNIGMIHVILGDYPKAIECYKESLNLRDPATEIREIVNIQLNIGEVYLSLGDYTTARHLFQESLKMSREVGDKRYEAIALRALGNVYQELKEHDIALAYYQDALRRFEEIGLQNSIATALGNIASVHEAKGNYDLAFEFYQQSLTRLRELGDQPTTVRVMVLIGKLLITQKNYHLAKTYLNEALATAEALSMKRYCYEALEQLAVLYEHLGDFERAYRTHQQFHQTKQAVFNEDQGKKLAVQQALFENELARNEAERHKQENLELSRALAQADRLRKIAEEANQFKTELISIAAHDLKNPLQSIIGFAKIIQEDLENKEKISLASATIERAARRMHQLIEDLLNLSRIEANKIHLQKSKTNLAELLCTVAELNRPNAESKAQTIELNVADDCIAEVDPERMREVFDNLLSNAIKYSPKEKRIIIECRKRTQNVNDTQSTILVSVKDEGQGLTEGDKAKLFEKFQRLSAKPTGGESSTGLGLAIVKQLVELHGGKVWAESDGKDKGATFFIELPAV